MYTHILYMYMYVSDSWQLTIGKAYQARPTSYMYVYVHEHEPKGILLEQMVDHPLESISIDRGKFVNESL